MPPDSFDTAQFTLPVDATERVAIILNIWLESEWGRYASTEIKDEVRQVEALLRLEAAKARQR